MYLYVYIYVYVCEYINVYCIYIYSVKNFIVVSWIFNFLFDFVFIIIVREGFGEIWKNVMFIMSWKILLYMY